MNPKPSDPVCTSDQTFVCPLCPLHCDDVQISKTGEWIADGCSLVSEFGPQLIAPMDRGEIDVDVTKLTRPIRGVTTGVDLATARQLSDWHHGGKIDLTIESDPSIQALIEVISRDGIVSATLADVATHADLVWMIGDVEKTWPRLLAKLRRKSANGGKNGVMRFGSCSADALAEFAAATESASRLAGQTTAKASCPTQKIDRWHSAQYAAIIVGPGAFKAGEETISATMLCRIARLRNQNTRCVLLTLDAAATLRSVCLWKTNESPASVEDQLTNAAFDVRLGSPRCSDSRPAALQIGGVDPGPRLAKAYRASSIAGLHRRGMVIRGDGSVSLPLSAPIPSDMVTPGEVLSRLWIQ
ncbi:formylmethanofuran dehydrogenase [Aporhodopirellula aestuarii]|uniref:Formylmethanofuran dehydrogenase n=1 Tax=Aporhodopirellula aestuarii TaxID=2950107 RepID=A0ABT0U396_9BACT|nr:formylmethanofuran dehydrogenase [Aporhodopirellula aestuarii]MCM2371298.1 formylmethanofuran dehydrogenase [Aporhodopirellula aestuarii]